MSDNYSVAQHKKIKASPTNRMSSKHASQRIIDCIVHLKVQSASDKKTDKAKQSCRQSYRRIKREAECVLNQWVTDCWCQGRERTCALIFGFNRGAANGHDFPPSVAEEFKITQYFIIRWHPAIWGRAAKLRRLGVTWFQPLEKKYTQNKVQQESLQRLKALTTTVRTTVGRISYRCPVEQRTFFFFFYIQCDSPKHIVCILEVQQMCWMHFPPHKTFTKTVGLSVF